MKKMKIAHIGTFDVENFGDLLFPDVLKYHLGEEYDIDLFSPLGGKKPFDDAIVFPINKLEEKLKENNYSAIIIGGGDLIRTDKKICIKNDVYGYSVEPSLELWAYPIILGNKYNIPVILNSIGVTNNFDENEKFIVQTLLENASYISTRDTEASNTLKKIGIFNIPIVPDTVLTIKDVYSDSDLDNTYQSLINKKIVPQIDNYIIFQHNSTNIDKKKYYNDIISLIKNVSKNHKILLMPIGYIHDDDKILKKIADENISNVYSVSLDKKLSPMEMISIIKHSYGYIGTSMHGAVVSYAFEKKIMILNSMNSKKLHGFANIISKTNLDVNDSNLLTYIYNNFFENQDIKYDNKIHKKIIEQFNKFKEIINSGYVNLKGDLTVKKIINQFYENYHDNELIGEYYEDNNDYLNRSVFKYYENQDGYYIAKIEKKSNILKLKPIINKLCIMKKLFVDNKEILIQNLSELYSDNSEIDIISEKSNVEIKIKVEILSNDILYHFVENLNDQYIKIKKENISITKDYEKLLNEYKKIEKKYCNLLKEKNGGDSSERIH